MWEASLRCEFARPLPRSGQRARPGRIELARTEAIVIVYVLVILKDGWNAEAKPLHAAAHETFISSLIKRNVVLLGGAFADAVDDAFAAYVLRCDDVDEARRIASEDPFAVNHVVSPKCVAWELVGVNPEAIDRSAVIRPGHV